MPKHKKQRRTKRSQRGGGVMYDWFGIGNPDVPVYQSQVSSQESQGWGDWFSGVGTKTKEQANNLITSADNIVGTAANTATEAVSGAANAVTSAVSFDTTQPPYTSPPYNPEQVVGGGRRGRKSKKLRGRKLHGGKGGLGLTYYATDVSGMKVADPTYWIKGGSRRSLKKTRHRKSR